MIADERPFRDALRALGAHARPVVWTDPEADWIHCDAIVVRTTWDYTTKRPEFMEWASMMEATAPFFNDLATIRWNTHKRYLTALADAGARIVPFVEFERGARVDLPALLRERGWARAVVKPLIGATARRQIRVDAGDAADLRASQAHLDEALREEDMLVQPYVASVEREGEVSLISFGGEYSHAVRKRPKAGDYRVQADWGGSYANAEPTRDEQEASERAIGAIPAAMRALGETPPDEPLLYARVDLVEFEGAPAVIEVEVVEPQLFFLHAPDPARAGMMMARALLERLG